MTSLISGAAAIAAMSVAMCGSAKATATYDQAFVQAYAYAGANSNYNPQSSSNRTSFFTANPLSAEAYATASDGGTVAIADEFATASFINPSLGSLKLYGTTSVSVVTPSGEAVAYNGAGSFAFYYFSVDVPSEFDLSYVTNDSNELGYSVSYQLAGGSSVYQGFNLINSSGNERYSIAPGLYSFSVYADDYEDRVSQSGVGSGAGRYNDVYNFSISSAPEPSAWALMIAGTAVAGLALRRRRPGAAMAAG